MIEPRYTMFGTHHTADEWDLVQTSLSVGSPEVKTEYEELDGGNGTIDLTEALAGDVTYGDREVTWTFARIGPREENAAALSAMRNALHGRKMEIRLQDYPGRWLVGRVTVGEADMQAGYATVEVTAVCQPFFRRATRSMTVKLSSGLEANCTLRSGRMPAPLRITSDTPAKVEVGGRVWAVSVGSGYTAVGLRLHEGDNPVRLFDGSAGTVKLEWEWGEL